MSYLTYGDTLRRLAGHSASQSSAQWTAMELSKAVRRFVKNCLKAADITVAGNKAHGVFTVKTLACGCQLLWWGPFVRCGAANGVQINVDKAPLHLCPGIGRRPLERRGRVEQ